MWLRELSGIVVAAAVAGCQGPPGWVVGDGAPEPADAAVVVDAESPPDAAPPLDVAVDAEPGVNPHGIWFTEVTAVAWDDVYLGGRAADDDTWGMGAGAAIGDVNGDGALDLVFARIDDAASSVPGGPLALLVNDGPGAGFAHFTPDVEWTAQLAGIIGHAVAMGDYDRDGDLDVFIGASGPDLLLQNDGSGHFSDVAARAGVSGPIDDDTVGALWADVNHDGLLDLYVAQYTNTTPPIPNPGSANRLHLNRGDGGFDDVSAAAEVDTAEPSQAVAAADLSRTGNIDLYVANDGPRDSWYRLTGIDPSGVPVFEDVAEARGLNPQGASMGVAIADLDGDLTPDVHVSDWGPNVLYLNPTPGGPVTFAAPAFDVARPMIFGAAKISWGVRFVDLDRDGGLELVVANGGIDTPVMCDPQLDWLLRQPAAGMPFVDITAEAGFPTTPCDTDRPKSGRGAIFGDLDGDGDDDLIVTPFIEEYRVYRNDTPAANHEVRVRLRGSVSAPDPIGATLEVTRLDGSRAIAFRHGGGDTYSQSDGVITIGLGAAAGVADARIQWPSGLQQRIDGYAWFEPDHELVIVEPLWLEVAPRTVEAAGAAELIYTAVDASGLPLGAAGAGRGVTVVRSDGLPVTVVDAGDGTYTASLPHPGPARRTVLAIEVDGVAQRPRPIVDYK